MYASPELKDKIVKLVKEHVEKNGIKLKFNTKIIHSSRIVLNISGCSIDLVQNFKDQQAKVLSRHPVGSEQYLAALEKINACDDLNREYSSLPFSRHNIDGCFSGEAAELLTAIKNFILVDHTDNSNSMSDYFDCSYGWELSIGGTKKGFTPLTLQD